MLLTFSIIQKLLDVFFVLMCLVYFERNILSCNADVPTNNKPKAPSFQHAFEHMNNDGHLRHPNQQAMKDHTLLQTLNTSQLLKEAIAAGNTDDIDKYNKAHHAAMKKFIAECPYCDPDWDDVPNLPEAMKGYDVAMGNPDPGLGNYDPGIRNQIFNPMLTNDDGFRELDGRYITANPLLKCDSEWTEKIFHTFEDYIRGKVEISTIGYGIELAKDVKVNIPYHNLVTVGVQLPTLLSRSTEGNKYIKELKFFFERENGSIAISQAMCSTHKVDLVLASAQKQFTEQFLDSMVALHNASYMNKESQRREFNHFVTVYGTHFASKSVMGVKVYSERRYSSKEKGNNTDDDLMRCNTLVATKVIGIQGGNDKDQCKDKELTMERSSNTDIKSHIISTYGSYGKKATDIAGWSKQIQELEDSGILYPRVLKRELLLIIRLFNHIDFPIGFKHNGFEIDVDKILEWFVPFLSTYCESLNMTCPTMQKINATKIECKINCNMNESSCNGNNSINFRGCKGDQICTNVLNYPSDIGESLKSIELTSPTCGIQYERKSLMNGGTYIGPVDRLKRPHGMGKEYFPPSNKRQRLKYYGHYLNGKKHGNGTLYNVNGGVSYQGKFVKGKPQRDANGENSTSSSLNSKDVLIDQKVQGKQKETFVHGNDTRNKLQNDSMVLK